LTKFITKNLRGYLSYAIGINSTIAVGIGV
jgi:hypothetical protein